ncbi:MAG: hypothetical protein ACI4OT_02285 [Bacilli bacterium]
MNLIRKMIGFKAKDLYIAEPGINKIGDSYISKEILKYTGNPYLATCTEAKLIPITEKIVIVRKRNTDNNSKLYKNIDSGDYYGKFGSCYDDNAMVVKIIRPLLPVDYNKRIKYSDILELQNKDLSESEVKVKTLKLRTKKY